MAARRRRVVWTQRAIDAVDGIAEYVATDSPVQAARMVDAFVDAAATLDTLPDRGRPVPEVAKPNIREIFVYDFRLMYRVLTEQVDVLTVVHGAQNFRPRQLDR